MFDRKNLSDSELRNAILRLQRRLTEVQALDFRDVAAANDGHELDALDQKLASTLTDIFGEGSRECDALMSSGLRPVFNVWMSGMDTSVAGNLDIVRNKVAGRIKALETQIEILQERQGERNVDPEANALRAYDGLSLHPEIDRAVSKLYRDGHYSNAVESAVKALNGLVRLRSGLDVDGSKLMDKAFGGADPLIQFNDLNDDSARNEQQGFHFLFKGAVAGLRNPRAHSFIEDQPERALEFIAFVSLLAKLMDEARA